MRVAVIGAGTVGRAVGVGLLKKGNVVTFYDTNSGVLMKLASEGRTTANSSKDAIGKASVVFLCLPTPLHDGALDVSYIEASIKEISNIMENQIIVLKSTVLPGTTRKLSRFLPAEQLVYNPEFLTEKAALRDFLSPQRVVIGTQSEHSTKILKKLYEPFQAPIIVTDWETAEFSKLVANSFLATKISFFNEIWALSRALGVDEILTEKIVAADQRIGGYGTHGGLPYDGRCLPKDTQAFHNLGKRYGLQLEVVGAALRANHALINRGLTLGFPTPQAR